MLGCQGQGLSVKRTSGPLRGKLDGYLNQLQEAGFEQMPKGWNRKSVKKWTNTLAKEEVNAATKKGFFDKCVKKMKGKVQNPEGLCAAAKDEAHGSTYWRGKDKSSKEIKKDVKKHQNV